MNSYEQIIKAVLDAENQGKLKIAQAEEQAIATKEKAYENAKTVANEHRATKQAEFEQLQANHDDSKDRQALKAKTDKAAAENEALFNKNKDEVVDMIVDRVLNVDYALPKNVKKDYSQLASVHAAN